MINYSVMLKEKMSIYTYTQKEKTFKSKKNSFFINLELNPNIYSKGILQADRKRY
jgi:hypothetical protein